MKRMMCAILCGIMLLFAAGSLAAASYSLPEKMDKQLSIGSGLKGDLTIHGEGNHPLILALSPLQDVELQYRGLRAGEEAHYYAYQAGEGETQKGLTEIYMKGDQTWFRSDLLPGEIYTLPGLEEIAEKVIPAKEGKPSIASALVRWLRLSGEERASLVDSLTAKLSGALEIWAAGFVNVSEVRTLENGTSVVDLVYDIPMSEIKTEIVALMNQVIESEEGRRLLDALLDDEQKAVFANRNLDYYYTEALSALDSHFDVMYTQTVSTLGSFISSTLELPLDDRFLRGYESLTVEQQGGLISFTLRGEERDITLQMASAIDWEQISAFSAWITIQPGSDDAETAKGMRHALRVDVSRSSELTTDEETRDHLRENWIVTAERDVSHLPEGQDASGFPEETPIQAILNLHFYSRYSQSSPTTLEFEAKVARGAQSVSVSGSMKTASPWTLTPFDTEGAVDLSTLSRQQLVVKAAEMLASASEQFTPAENNTAEPTAEPETTAEPGASAEPESEEPEATEKPETAQSETTSEPDASAEPETEEPEATSEPETADESEAASEPETADEPEVTSEPETAVESRITTDQVPSSVS